MSETPNVEPAEPTEAQQEQRESQGESEGTTVKPQAVSASDKPSEEAINQARRDAEVRGENPNKAVTREANPNVAGESFEYLKHVSR